MASKGVSLSGKHHPSRGRTFHRSNAKNRIEYDSAGSYHRRPSADDDDDSDMSVHSQEQDWSVDEFSVHGKQDVAEMNKMLRYLGLPGPSQLGIESDQYEMLKRSPSWSPSQGIHSFRHDDDQRPSFCETPSPGRDVRVSPGPERTGRQFSRRASPLQTPTGPQTNVENRTTSVESRTLSGPQTDVENRTTSVDNRTSTAAEAAAPNPSHEHNESVSRKGRAFGGFADVVKQVVVRNKQFEEEHVALSIFIEHHREEVDPGNLQRVESSPCRFEDSQFPPLAKSETDSVAPHHLERAQSEPVASSLGDAGDQNNQAQNNQAPSPTTTVQSKRNGGVPPPQSSMNTTRKNQEGGGGGKPILKPPPRMNIYSMPQQEQMSTNDMLGSLAPGPEDLAAILAESDEEEKASDNEEGKASDIEEGKASEIEDETTSSDVRETRTPEKFNAQSNGDGITGDEGKPVGKRSDLTVDLPDRSPIAQLVKVVGRNEDTGPVVAAPYQPVGPKHPWTKGDMLGAGSFGTVYDAVDSEGMWFAVKEVSMVENDKAAQQAIDQLMQEIALLSSFKHENIVQYLGTEKAHGKLYIFLELVSKGSLAGVIKKVQLTHSQICAYTRQILRGLSFLHARSIVHRDIKCANILVDTTGVCKLADFGMAKQIGSLDQTKSCKGSAYWMAPEVIDPIKTYGFPADIWSLGCSILEMFTRAPPFGEMEWYRVLWTVGHGNAPPIPDDLANTAKDFLKCCLEINPLKRPTAGQLLEHPFVRQGSSTSSPHGPIEPLAESLVLQTIREEQSTDFATGRTQGAESLSNGH